MHLQWLGTRGYRWKQEQWRIEDEAVAQSNILPPFANIPDEWARSWARAREKFFNIPLHNFKEIREEIARFILDEILSPKGSFRLPS